MFANIMIAENIARISSEIGPGVQLVVVSKFRSTAEIMEAFNAGQRVFAENKVQLLLERHATLPADIEWHMIGHLQTNKVKLIAPFISMIHSIDSMKLLKTVSEQAVKCHRTIDCLLQIHIASEETKYGLSEEECTAMLESLKTTPLPGIRIRGLMGMASNTENAAAVESEFKNLYTFYSTLKDAYHFDTLSMGMSGDYKIAVRNGSSMVRIGSMVFA